MKFSSEFEKKTLRKFIKRLRGSKVVKEGKYCGKCLATSEVILPHLLRECLWRRDSKTWFDFPQQYIVPLLLQLESNALNVVI